MKKKGLIILVIIFFVMAIAEGTYYGIKCYKAKQILLQEQERIRNTVTSTIIIDVNPSIEVDLNRDNEVINVKSLNEDSEELLKDTEFKYNDLKNTLDKIVVLLKENDYLGDDDNTILVNVVSDNEELSSIVENNIKEIVEEKEINTELVMQEVKETEELTKLASDYGMSYSKAYYISEQIKETEGLTIEEFKEVSLDDVKTKVESYKEEKAKEAAQKAAQEYTPTYNTGNNGGTSSSGSCNPPSNLKDAAWCSFNTSRPQWCEFSYPEKANSYSLSQTVYSKIGISQSEVVGMYSTQSLYSGASYCYAYKTIVTTRSYRYTVLYDSVTGEVLEQNKVPVPQFVSEESVKQKALALFGVNEADAQIVWVTFGTNNEGSEYWYYRYQVNIQMPDNMLHSADYNAVTGALVTKSSRKNG